MNLNLEMCLAIQAPCVPGHVCLRAWGIEERDYQLSTQPTKKQKKGM